MINSSFANESLPSLINHSGHISSSSSSSAVSVFAFYILPKYSKNSSKDKDPSEFVSNALQHLKISSYIRLESILHNFLTKSDIFISNVFRSVISWNIVITSFPYFSLIESNISLSLFILSLIGFGIS